VKKGKSPALMLEGDRKEKDIDRARRKRKRVGRNGRDGRGGRE
jgi:hypothetical protein